MSAFKEVRATNGNTIKSRQSSDASHNSSASNAAGIAGNFPTPLSMSWGTSTAVNTASKSSDKHRTASSSTSVDTDLLESLFHMEFDDLGASVHLKDAGTPTPSSRIVKPATKAAQVADSRYVLMPFDVATMMSRNFDKVS